MDDDDEPCLCELHGGVFHNGCPTHDPPQPAPSRVVELSFQVPMSVAERLSWQREQMYYVTQNESPSTSGTYPWAVRRITANGDISTRLFKQVEDAIPYTKAAQDGLLLDGKTPTMKGELQ